MRAARPLAPWRDNSACCLPPGKRGTTSILNLFTGVHTARLLGLVWFDAVGSRDWRLSNAAAAAAFRRAARAYKMPLP